MITWLEILSSYLAWQFKENNLQCKYWINYLFDICLIKVGFNFFYLIFTDECLYLFPQINMCICFRARPRLHQRRCQALPRVDFIFRPLFSIWTISTRTHKIPIFWVKNSLYFCFLFSEAGVRSIVTHTPLVTILLLYCCSLLIIRLSCST